MKYKTTRKAIVDGAINIRSAGYCDLQALLYNHAPIAYTCGIYGWNFDVYNVYGITICTGYRNMPGKRLDGIGEYESKARAILDNYTDYNGIGGHERKKAEIETLLQEFCKLNGGRV